MILYRNLTVLDRLSPWYNQLVEVAVSDEGTYSMGPSGSLQVAPKERVDCSGEVLATGFADLGAESPMPGYPGRGTLRELAEEAFLGGFTDVAIYPTTDPPLDTSEAVAAFKQAATSLPVRLHPYGAVSKSLKGEQLAELHALRSAGVVGFADGIAARQNPELLRLALEYTRNLGLPILHYPSTGGFENDNSVHESTATVGLGLATLPAEAEAMGVRQASEIAAYTNGNLLIGPISTQQACKALEKVADSLVAFTNPHYLLLTDQQLSDFDPRYKWMPPLRSKEDVHVLREAVASGLVRGIASGHTPVSIEEKQHDFVSARAGGPTLHSLFAVLNTALVQTGVMSPEQLLALLHVRNRELLGLKPLVLDAGYRGPLFRLQLEADYAPYRPKQVYALADPFADVPLKGRVLPLCSFKTA